MRRMFFVLVFAALFFNAQVALADFYKWTDADGVVHITDDMDNVPGEFRTNVKTYKTEPRPKEAPGVEERVVPEEEMAELYGDNTLEWWKETFNKLNEEINSLEAGIAVKKQYNEVYEAGRRFGQVFGTKEIETYDRNKKELVAEGKRLEELKEEREELRRKATIYGVPRYIRGE